MMESELMGEEVGKMRGNREGNNYGCYMKRWVTKKF